MQSSNLFIGIMGYQNARFIFDHVTTLPQLSGVDAPQCCTKAAPFCNLDKTYLKFKFKPSSSRVKNSNKYSIGYTNSKEIEGIVSYPKHQHPSFLKRYIAEKEKLRIKTLNFTKNLAKTPFMNPKRQQTCADSGETTTRSNHQIPNP
jgi:hypothetical protein